MEIVEAPSSMFRAEDASTLVQEMEQSVRTLSENTVKLLGATEELARALNPQIVR